MIKITYFDCHDSDLSYIYPIFETKIPNKNISAYLIIFLRSLNEGLM